MNITRITTALAAVAVMGVALAGCSSAAPSDTANADVQTIADGTLTVGMSPDFPPLEYMDGDKLVGADVDLITEVANRMGLKLVIEQSKFDQLINSVRTARVDIVISGMTDTLERQQTLDFVDYYNSTGRFYTTGDQASTFSTAEDICGKAVAVSTKTDYYPALQRFNDSTCVAGGLGAVDIVGTDSGAAARLQLDQGRAQLAIQGAENLAYFETQDPGKYVVVGPVLTELPFGVAVSKDNTALSEKVRDTLSELLADGTSKEIFGKYNLGDGLIEPVINGVTE